MNGEICTGDRVRIVYSAWACDCGTVITVRKNHIRVKVDTPPHHVVIVSPDVVERYDEQEPDNDD